MAEKKSSLDSILDKLQTTGTIFNGTEAALKDKRIVFDSPRLTWAYGGLKLNAIHRLNGVESGGKTTIATYIAAQCQKRKFEEEGNYNNCHVIILDYERSLDVIRAQQIGLILQDPTNGKPLVHVLRPDYIEDGETMWEEIVQTGQVCCTILDSDTSAPNHTEMDNEIGKASFGGGAKAVGIVVKRMNIFVDKYCTPVIWISQERANMNLLSHLPTITGGFAINYYASTRFRVTQGNPADFPKENGEQKGIIIRLKNYKNKTAIPGREAFVTMYFDGGIDSNMEFIDMATELGIIDQHGAWFYLWNPTKDMSEYKEADKKTLDKCVEDGDLVKFSGGASVRDWWSKNINPEWIKAIKDKVNSQLLIHNDILDANTGEEDEEEQFQKERKLKINDSEEENSETTLNKE